MGWMRCVYIDSPHKPPAQNMREKSRILQIPKHAGIWYEDPTPPGSGS